MNDFVLLKVQCNRISGRLQASNGIFEVDLSKQKRRGGNTLMRRKSFDWKRGRYCMSRSVFEENYSGEKISFMWKFG